MAKHTSTKKETRAERKHRLTVRAKSMQIDPTYDVVVIGAGASGLTAAITACKNGASVAVFEKALEPGTKILATGNGRCNFSNANLEPKFYNHPGFVEKVFGDNPLQQVLDLFASCGLMWAEEQGRLYPKSFTAQSVLKVLLLAAQRLGIHIFCGREVDRITPCNDHYSLTLKNAWDAKLVSVSARSVIVASGGGANECMSDLKLNHIPLSPVLSPLRCRMQHWEVLDGKRVRAQVRLLRKDTLVTQEYGEVLFRSYGLSGVVIFNMSRYAKEHDTISLDLVPELSLAQLKEKMKEAPDVAAVVYGILDPMIANEILNVVQQGFTRSHEELCEALCRQIKAMDFLVLHTDFSDSAQVTRGGIACDDVDSATLESKRYPGLFICGEALDIDGACGGYNLSWAWISGMRAGSSAAQDF